MISLLLQNCTHCFTYPKKINKIEVIFKNSVIHEFGGQSKIFPAPCKSLQMMQIFANRKFAPFVLFVKICTICSTKLSCTHTNRRFVSLPFTLAGYKGFLLYPKRVERSFSANGVPITRPIPRLLLWF